MSTEKGMCGFPNNNPGGGPGGFDFDAVGVSGAGESGDGVCGRAPRGVSGAFGKGVSGACGVAGATAGGEAVGDA